MTEEKAVDFHRMGPFTLATTHEENIQFLSKTWISIATWPFHWSLYVRCFVQNKPKAKYMRSSNHIEHRRKISILTHTHKARLHIRLTRF